MVYIEEYESRKSIYRYSDRNTYTYTYIMEKFAEILLSLTQPTTAAGAYTGDKLNGWSIVGWLLELALVALAFIYSFMDYPFEGNDVITTNSTDGTQTNTGEKAVSEATTTTIFILIRLIFVFLSIAENFGSHWCKIPLPTDKFICTVLSLLETASAVLPVVGLSMMEASDNDEIDTCNNNQGIIHGFLIGSLAVRLIRTFVVLDVLGAQKPYNVFQRRDEENNASSANLSWKQRKANYASIRSKAKEEVTYNFQSSGVQRHDLI